MVYVPLKLLEDVLEIVEDQRVAVLPPPVPHDPVRQADQVMGLLLSVDHDPPELVGVDEGHRATSRSRDVHTCHDLIRAVELE
jgi:hypothetical protein